MKMQEIQVVEQVSIATLSMLSTKVNFVLLEHRPFHYNAHQWSLLWPHWSGDKWQYGTLTWNMGYNCYFQSNSIWAINLLSDHVGLIGRLSEKIFSISANLYPSLGFRIHCQMWLQRERERRGGCWG